MVHEAGAISHQNYKNLINGRKYIILISPSQTKADTNLVEVDVSKRECLMPSENDSSKLFKIYSQSNCITECKLTRAAEFCSCIPWNFPHFKDINHTYPLCKGRCFEEHMKDKSMGSCKSKCLESCELVSYSYVIFEEPIDVDQECQNLQNTKIQFQNQILLMNELDLESLAQPDPYKLSHECDIAMKQTTILTIKLATERVSVVTQQRRVSFSSQLAALGEKKALQYCVSYKVK